MKMNYYDEEDLEREFLRDHPIVKKCKATIFISKSKGRGRRRRRKRKYPKKIILFGYGKQLHQVDEGGDGDSDHILWDRIATEVMEDPSISGGEFRRDFLEICAKLKKF